VVSILGHTLNSDMWKPEAELVYSGYYEEDHKNTSIIKREDRLDNYKSTAAWVDHFIIHDDNFGMYFCLPVEALKRVTLPKDDPRFRAFSATAIIPPGVTTSLYKEVERASALITQQILDTLIDKQTELDIWSFRIWDAMHSELPRPVVLRSFLVKKEEYFDSLNQNDFDGNTFTKNEKDEIIKILPPLFWLSEITLPELYTANKHKVIDFFYRCDHSKKIDYDDEDINSSWIQVRLPGGLKRNPEICHSLATEILLSVKSHFPVFRFQDEQRVKGYNNILWEW
jgi:hypothetical protein